MQTQIEALEASRLKWISIKHKERAQRGELRAASCFLIYS